MDRCPLVLALLLGAMPAPLAAQRPPADPKRTLGVTEVALAGYRGTPYPVYVRAPDFIFFNGDLIEVRGRNLAARDSNGTARALHLRANGRDAALTVSVWTDTLIRAIMPAAQAVGITFAGPAGQRRDMSGEIGIVSKTRGWVARQAVRVAFVWNWHLLADRDGDGTKDIRYGGDDCDDRDRRRFSGNAEINDFLGLDEDCDPSTIGERDADADGYTDNRVFNWVSGRVTKRGQDCDDHRTNVNPRSVEACNDRDDNCDGWIDEELLNCPTANRRVSGAR